MEPNGYQFPQIVISSGERQVWPDGKHLNSVSSPERQVCPDGNARRRSASLFWQMVVRLLWFYLGTRGVPQNVVGASANSLWQGGWRRTHSVKGGLPK